MDFDQDRDRYSFSLLLMSNIITVVVACIVFLFYPLIHDFIKLDFPFLILMFVVFLFQPAYLFWTARQRYEYKYKEMLIWSIIIGILSPLVAIILIAINKEGERLYPRIFGAELTLLAFYIFFYFRVAKNSKFKISLKYWKYAFLFNLPLIIHYLSIYLLGSIDKLMISFLVSDSATAYYSVAHAVASIALLFWTAINGSLIPYTYKKCEQKKYDDINRVTLPLIALFSLGCVMVILMAPEIVGIMAPNEYREAIYVIPPIVGGVFFQVQYFVYANILYYYKKPAYVMIGSFVAVVLNVVLNYFCIIQWGYIAAGYTTILCYLVQALLDYLFMRIVSKAKIFNGKLILILSIVVIVISLLTNLIYDYIVPRYAILGIIIVLIIVFRKRLLRVVNYKNPGRLSESKGDAKDE